MPGVPGADLDRLGEVVEASVSHLVAQCHRLGEPPALGSLVRTSDGGLDRYGVVYDSSTRSIDPGRRSMALGQEEVSQEDVYRSHPELSQLLRTDFEALVVGYRDRGAFRHFLPPRPAAIHAFVFLASDEELRSFTKPLGFLHSLLGAAVSTRDEALAAFLRLAAPVHPDSDDFLLRAGKEVAALLAGDALRLNALLRRIKG